MAGQEKIGFVVVVFSFHLTHWAAMPYLHEADLHMMYLQEASQSAVDVSDQPFPDYNYMAVSPRL